MESAFVEVSNRDMGYDSFRMRPARPETVQPAERRTVSSVTASSATDWYNIVSRAVRNWVVEIAYEATTNMPEIHVHMLLLSWCRLAVSLPHLKNASRCAVW